MAKIYLAMTRLRDAEHLLRMGATALEQIGHKAWLAGTRGQLAVVLARQGRVEEGEIERARALALLDPVADQEAITSIEQAFARARK
jgi:hypothetical protein